jgi:hypothetical protein
MKQTLEIPGPLYRLLEQAANESGTTPMGWIASQLVANRRHGSLPGLPMKTLAERFAGRTGRIASGGKLRNSDNCGEKVTDDLVLKRQEFAL